ncbi:head GIN domain-containing protein [Maribacter sp. X9]|uniref:head GIN domain-containing protein n=1 Tax=Maribacter sp. X9 TaxID=3402159 RepID=UPI003AF3609D
MKLILTTTLLLCSTLFCLAQGTVTHTLGKFTELKVYDRIVVNLIKGDVNKLVILDKDKADIKILESDGTLKLKLLRENFLASSPVDIQLYYTEPLTVIDANENAKITASTVLKGLEVEIMAQEAAYVSLALNTEFATVKSISGSEIQLKGTTKVQDVYVNTGAKVFNKNLKTEETTVMVLAGGYAEVHGTAKVITKVKAGSTIIVYGKPKNLEKDDTFGGKIEVKQ